MTRHFTLCLMLFCLFQNSFAFHLTGLDDAKTPAPPTHKNKISLEILGNPLVLSYEHQFYNKGRFASSTHIGLNLGTAILTRVLPGFSFGINNSLRVGKNLSLFALTKVDFLSFTTPAKTWEYSRSRKTFNAIQDKYTFNSLSFNIGTALCYQTKKWDIAPLYPCFMYSVLSQYDDADIRSFSIALCSRITYIF